MTEPDDQETRPISVRELLARHGTIGAPPVGGRRRRRRGNADSVTVAELTGEIPIIGAEHHEAAAEDESAIAEPDESAVAEHDESATTEHDEPAVAEASVTTNGTVAPSGEGAVAPPAVTPEEMLPDPVYAEADYAEVDYPEVDYPEADADEEDAELAVQQRELDEFDEPPSYLHAVREPLFGGRFEDGLHRDEPHRRDEPDEPAPLSATTARLAKTTRRDEQEHAQAGPPHRMQQIGRGVLIVLQSMLAVAFGAGLFIGFDQLWKWNNIIALVLSVLVILGLVVGVRIVRKTEDITSTLIAVAVGALVTLGPLALLQSG